MAGVMGKLSALVMLVLLLLVFVQSSQARIVHVDGLHAGTGFVASKLATQSNVLRSELLHRDYVELSLNASNVEPLHERFREAVIRSRIHHSRLENRVKQLKSHEQQAAVALSSPVSSGSGDYLMEISLGTPAQKFTVIMDTGSDLCWVQCLPCTNCFEQTGPQFDPTKSTTYKNSGCSDSMCKTLGDDQSYCSSSNTCSYIYGYGDGSSTQGDLAYDAFTLGHQGPAAGNHVAIGCGHDSEGTFSGAGGLVGLGQGPLSLNSQLKPSISDTFSYCLVSFSALATTTSPITFGDSSTAQHSGPKKYTPIGTNKHNPGKSSGPMKYTPIVTNKQNPAYYYVNVEGISVGGQRLAINVKSVFGLDPEGGGGAILDSGTTLTYWQSSVFNAITAAYKKLMTYPTVDGQQSYSLALCFDITGIANVTIPEMVIHFTGADFAVPAQNSFVTVNESGNTMCLAMDTTADMSVIGNIQQQNNLFVYDVAHKRIGFQPTQSLLWAENFVMDTAGDMSVIGNIQQQNNLIVYDVAHKRIGFQPTQCDSL